jgi:hypothetical protein
VGPGKTLAKFFENQKKFLNKRLGYGIYISVAIEDFAVRLGLV